MTPKYVIKERDNGAIRTGRYYFVLLAPNGTVLATSPDFASKAGVFNGIASIQEHADTEIVEDQTPDGAGQKGVGGLLGFAGKGQANTDNTELP